MHPCSQYYMYISCTAARTPFLTYIHSHKKKGENKLRIGPNTMVDLRYIEVELGKVKERLLVPGASWCPGGVLKARPGPDLRRR